MPRLVSLPHRANLGESSHWESDRFGSALLRESGKASLHCTRSETDAARSRGRTARLAHDFSHPPPSIALATNATWHPSLPSKLPRCAEEPQGRFHH